MELKDFTKLLTLTQTRSLSMCSRYLPAAPNNPDYVEIQRSEYVAVDLRMRLRRKEIELMVYELTNAMDDRFIIKHMIDLPSTERVCSEDFEKAVLKVRDSFVPHAYALMSYDAFDRFDYLRLAPQADGLGSTMRIMLGLGGEILTDYRLNPVLHSLNRGTLITIQPGAGSMVVSDTEIEEIEGTVRWLHKARFFIDPSRIKVTLWDKSLSKLSDLERGSLGLPPKDAA